MNHFKLLATVCLLFVFVSGYGQRNLTIRKNQTKNITNGTRSLVLDTLIIEDNARIVIAEDVPAFSLIARHVIIGTNVTIDGRRATVSGNGENGLPGNNAIEPCRNGGIGQPGKSGSSGANGADIFLYLSIRSIGSMKIIVEGTKGGNGGNGGKGGNGGDGKLLSCTVGRGGNGGVGGNGGTGGAGGHVILNYRIIDESGNVAARQSQLNEVQVEFAGGEGGAGGNGGSPGLNGKSVPAGISTTPSQNGANGIRGDKGAEGFYLKTLTR